ncbi:NfeD family protein [Lacunisphaera limnophila]|nr:NfeD family protein [Lacunisphaera limnophila]
MFVVLLVASLAGQAQEPAATAAPAVTPKTVVYVIPVRDEISTPTLYILRRGLKEAIERKADVVLLDMDTPGGALDKTFEIMEALEKFPGLKLTYVNKEAMSAGAFISAATDEIYFAPSSVIGAAAPVLSTGGDVDKTMKQKIVSYLRARVRATSEGKGYRGQAIEAMIDEDFEFKIGDKVLKPKGELLSLTASEAMQPYGEPPQALLGAGKAADIAALLAGKYGAGNYTVHQFEVTWSEKVAQYLNAIAPILMGLGMLALFVEFKTPGFGWPGIAGLVMLGVVFLGHYVAGFSGHEPVLLFALGLLLISVELFFFPGLVVAGVTGAAMVLGSLVWAMADIWPHEPIRFSRELFLGPLQNLGLALVITAALAAALLRYLPRAWFWDKMVLATAIAGTSGEPVTNDPLIGAVGVTVTPMFPSGEVAIDGRRYEAKLALGHVAAGTPVVVLGREGFALLVEPKIS